MHTPPYNSTVSRVNCLDAIVTQLMSRVEFMESAVKDASDATRDKCFLLQTENAALRQMIEELRAEFRAELAAAKEECKAECQKECQKRCQIKFGEWIVKKDTGLL